MTAEPDVKQGQLNPAALGPDDLARLLSAASGVAIDADDVRADIDAGAPSNPDGTLNLSESGDMIEAAANLYRMLREADAGGVATIAVMPIPREGLGEAINDRLTRAAAPRGG